MTPARSALFKVKQLLELPVQRDAQHQRQLRGGVELPRLDGADGVARHAHQLRQLRLRQLLLDARLLAACGKGLDDLYKKRWERIAKIKERGKLRSDSEFYLINEHIDYLINMGAPDEETELFDSMLFDYEERARKRREKREKQKKDKS